MKDIISRKTLIKKMIPMGLIGVVLGCGLYAYNDHRDFLSNFKLYHVKSYIAAVSYKTKNLHDRGYMASLAGVFATEKDMPVASGEPSEQNNAKSVPVLLYHGVIGNADGANILLEDFKNQMFALKKAGWQTVTIKDFYAFMQGKKELPDKSFLLTFDDGRKDSYYPVDPILKALDYNAVIYVITKYSLGDRKSNYYLSKSLSYCSSI